MANKFNNDSIFNGTATFNNTISLSDISANTVTANSVTTGGVTLRNSGDITGVGTVNADTVTANTSISTPTVSLNYNVSNIPSLSANNIGYISSTSTLLGSGAIPQNSPIAIYNLPTGIGYFIVNLQINVNNLQYSNQIYIYLQYYNNGVKTTTQINQSWLFNNNSSYNQTIQGTWFIEQTNQYPIIGYIVSAYQSDVQIPTSPSGQLQAIRIA